MFKLKLLCVLLCLIPLNWSAAISDNPRQIEIFSFVAPEEYSQPRSTAHSQPQAAFAPSKIHQQVIFIKNPETQFVPHQQVRQNVAPSATEQQTHIYVLTPESSHTHNVRRQPQLHQSAHHINHKPEVKFINYHKPGEAEQIQAQIIRQYGGDPNSVIG